MPHTNSNWNQGFELLDANGAALDITGADIRLTVRKTATDASALIAATTSNYLTLTVPTEGKFEIDVPKATMGAIPAGTYPYDCVRVNGSKWEWLFGGEIIVRQGVV